MKSNIKEKIIESTIALINGSNGIIEEVTVRKISEKANIGVGLINYHFGTKNKLIEECVQRIIVRQIRNFNPGTADLSLEEKAYITTQKVADYLWENKAVSTISILGDYVNPHENDNSMKSVAGFMHTVGENASKLETFFLVSLMQVVFMKSEIMKKMGYDLDNKKQRDELMKMLVDKVIFKER